MLNWNSKVTWIVLTILILALGVIWIVFSKVSPDMAVAHAASSPLPRRGVPAPDFTLETLEDQTIALSDLQGQA